MTNGFRRSNVNSPQRRHNRMLDAIGRQAASELRSTDERLALINSRPGNSTKERGKL